MRGCAHAEIRGAEEIPIPVTAGDDPLSCVALGVGKVLDELDLLKKVAIPA